MKLNDRQRMFVDQYLIDFNATQAAIRAGYSKKTANRIGSRLLTNVVVQKAIEARKAEKEKELIAEQDEVLRAVTAVLRGQELGTALVGAGKGWQSVEAVPPTISEKLKAAELLGKFYKTWTDRQEVDVNLPQFIEDVPEDDD